MTRKMCAGQTQMLEPTNGDIVQELLVPSRDGLDAPGELR